jgi:hypothetical protein
VTGGCAIRCSPPFPDCIAEFFFGRQTSKIHSSYKQFAKIDKMLEKGFFFYKKYLCFFRILKKNFIAGLFSLSGLSREIRRVWENMLKMLSWSFG